MNNKKLASHRRQIAVYKKKIIKEKIESDNLKNIQCKNLSLNSLLVMFENINPVFFTFDKKKNHILCVTVNYQESSDSKVSPDAFSRHYFIKIKDNKMALFSNKEFLFEDKDVSSFTLKDIAFYMIEKIKNNFHSEMKESGYLSQRTGKINYLLREFCKQHDMFFEDIEYRKVSLEEIYNKEIKVKFNINNVLIEESIDLYINKNRLDMLDEVLRNKYSIMEVGAIKSLLNETDFSKEMKSKKRM